MKVLQINGVCRTGSTGKIVTGIEKELVKSGHQSIIAYSGNHENLEKTDKYYKIGSRLSTKRHQLIGYVCGDTGFHSTRETKRLIKFIEKETPDIVHLHNIYSFYLNVELLLHYLAEKRIKTVITVHDCWLLTGHCTHFHSVGCMKWKTQCYNCPLKKAYPPSLLLDRSRELFNKKKTLFHNFTELQVVCVSKWLRGIVEESILGSFPNRVIYNGVELDRFNETVCDNKRAIYDLQNKFIILGVSNGWGVNKGLNEFVELAKLLDHRYCIILVGLNPQQISSMPQNVIGIPKTMDFNELLAYYKMADVFVSFSKQETMGMVVVEAMSCGTPAIVMPSTASPELVSEETGFVNISGTPEECKIYIDQIFQNKKHAYSSACYERVKELFSAEINYQRYVRLYEEFYRD